MQNGENITELQAVDEKDLIECEKCPKKVPEAELLETVDGEVCKECAEDYWQCERCNDFTDNNSHYIRGVGSVCDACLDDYFWCERCEEYVHESDWNGEYEMCESCADDERIEEDGGVRYRNVDINSTDGQSDESGEVVKSLRTFGVELEMINAECGKLADLSQTLEKSVGVENDGSLGGGYGIEIQTPVLKGKKGEETLKGILDKVKSLGFGVNKTCGTHIHLGASDFQDKQEKKYIIRSRTNAYGDEDLVALLILEPSQADLLKFIDVGKILKFGDIHNKYIDENFNVDNALVVDGEIIYVSNDTLKDVVDCVNESGYVSKVGRGYIVMTSCALNYDYISFTGILEKLNSSNCYPIWCETQSDHEATRKLKTLMSFYVSIDDILLAMLAPTRRENRYCGSLKSGYALNDILRSDNYADLEHLWYKEQKTQEGKKKVAGRKGNGHDSSRYCGVNFHSLLSKNKTLEIRYHGGTLDYNKIVHWVSLHQTILDKVSSDKIKQEDIKKLSNTVHFEKKLDLMFNILGLSDQMRAYIIGRINTYNK